VTVATDIDRFYAESADAYDELWAPVMARLSAPLFDALPLEGARRVLDVGAGTGMAAAPISRRAPGAEIIGVDRLGSMLCRVPPMMRPAIMDATALGLRPGTFDVAFSSFVLFFVADPIAALGEMRRVVVPGGAIGFTSWGDEPDYPALSVWIEELADAGAPRAPALRHDLLNSVEKVDVALVASDLRPRRVWARNVEIQTDPSDFLRRMLAFGGRRRLAALSSEARTRCLRRVQQRICELEPDAFCDRSEVIYAIAQRPVG
jgi:ubiquinone/menaquinone biosynthesis C-methylase UbiE